MVNKAWNTSIYMLLLLCIFRRNDKRVLQIIILIYLNLAIKFDIFMNHLVLNVYAYKMDNAIIICSHENKKAGGWKRGKLRLRSEMCKN